jgi:glycosidase
MAAAALACVFIARAASSADVSDTAILQWFESTYRTQERRAPDLFAAGYGAVWLPPTGRADSGNQSVGYDVYDRFDLGRPGNPTLYGTETGLKTTVRTLQRAGASVYVDYVINHSGFSNSGTPGFVAAGDYPGFVTTLPGAVDGDYHTPFPPQGPNYEYQYRLAGLIDIDHRTNHQFIRSPVPGFANNIPAGTTPAFGRLADIPNENNRRLYPDRNLQPIFVFDPKTGEQNIPIYPFNNAIPMAGDPVPENAMGYLMRNAQWMVQSIGVDGFRVDAARHVYPFALDYFDRAVYRSSFRTNLDGSQRQVFSFLEAYTGDKDQLQSLTRKDINPANPGVIGGNRDVLDFPLFFALRDNLTANGTTNNFHNIRAASQDSRDDGLANNGSQAVAFAASHDDGGVYLSNVAHALVLMRPGNAVVYFNAKEHGDNRDFPKEGRGDALGGVFGNAITTLVNLRNTHGRGDFKERWVDDAFNPNGFSNIYVFERENSAVVGLNSRLDGGFDLRSGVQTAFATGTPLVELTGNAASATVDPFNDIPEVLTVDAQGRINLRIPRNRNANGAEHGRGYVIYGLATPQGGLSLSGISSTLAPETPTAATNGTARLSAIDVVTGNTFQVNLNTARVTLSGNIRDRPADGDNALVRIDEGLDLNNNGQIDYRNPASTSYGFEEFLTLKNPGYVATDGNGAYSQTIDATKLSEGLHFLTVRAYRQRSDGGPAIFQDFRRSLYVDRFKPVSAVDSFDPWQGGTAADRDLIVHSTDQTADNVHILFDLGAAVTDQQILAMIGAGTQADRLDRDLWKKGKGALVKGNHVATVVTYEITGNYNVQRFPGLFVNSAIGRGVGDLNHDGTYTERDVSAAGGFEQFLYSRNAQFDAAGDVNADGKIDSKDLFALRTIYDLDSSAANELESAIRRRGDLSHDGATNHADIDHLYDNLSQQSWENDLNSDGLVNAADVQTLVEQVLRTNFGDADLDGQVGFVDFQRLELGFGQSNGSWQYGDFNGDNRVTFADFLILREHYGAPTPSDAAALDAFAAAHVPEPVSPVLVAACALLLNQRRRRSIHPVASPTHVSSAGSGTCAAANASSAWRSASDAGIAGFPTRSPKWL